MMTQPGDGAHSSGDTQRTVAPPPAPPSAPRPVISWIAAAGVAIIVVLLVRTLVAYPLLPIGSGLANLQGIGNGNGSQTTGSLPPVATSTLVPTPASSLIGVSLRAISMASSGSGWAIGYDNGGAQPSPILLRYYGGSWSLAPVPSTGTLTGIQAVSDDEAWATAGGSILHYLNGRWTTDYSSGDLSVGFAQLAMISPDEGWVIGEASSDTGSQPLIFHRQGGVWSPDPLPQFSDTVFWRGISMRSAVEGWAVGVRDTASGTVSFALHYADGVWVEDDQGLPGGAAEGVAAVGPGEAWATGYAGPMGPGYIAHFQNGVWIEVASPTPNMLHAVAMLSPTQGWIAGDGAATLRMLPDGTWVKEGLVIHGIALSGISMVSASEGWAVGGDVMLHYLNGVWYVYDLRGMRQSP